MCRPFYRIRGKEPSTYRGQNVLPLLSYHCSQRKENAHIHTTRAQSYTVIVLLSTPPFPCLAQDFTCLTFIDDSPPLQTWGRGNVVVDSKNESDRSSGRAVLGTATGDLYVFVQRGVRLVPREVRLNHRYRPAASYEYVLFLISITRVSPPSIARTRGYIGSRRIKQRAA